jgi:hypothetical protein
MSVPGFHYYFESIMLGAICYFALEVFEVHVDQILNIFLFKILKNVVKYPHTTTTKDQKSLPTVKIALNKCKDETELVSAISDQTDLILSGKASECAQIIEALFKWKKEFLTDRMDYIVVSKMGIELLVIEFDNNIHNRSIFIDLTRVRDETLKIHSYVSFFWAVLVALFSIVSRNFVEETF